MTRRSWATASSSEKQSINRATPRDSSLVALCLIIVAALALRFYNLDWDGGAGLHPDELYVARDVLVNRITFSWPPDLANLLDLDHSLLNPRSVDPTTGAPREFPYGALPLLVTEAVALLLTAITHQPWTSGDQVYLVGRALSALLDSLTVLVIFAVGRTAYSTRVGLISALLYATAPMAIQLAHFFTTDAWLTFFVSLAIYGAIRASSAGAFRWFAFTGAAFGAALATKGSVFALAGLIAAAILFDAWGRWRLNRHANAILARASRQAALASGAAVLVFALFEPYALLRPGIYLQSLRTQAAIVSGTADMPFTRIYIGTLPVIYQIEQFVRWGVGPIAGIAALAGVGLIARRCWRRPTAGAWILLCWLVGYGLVIAVAEAKFLRYLAPLLPVFAVAAAVAIDAGFRRLSRRQRPLLTGTALTAVLLGCLAWSFAFLHVYAGEHPRLTASRWSYANVPPGSTLSHDLWDDVLPVSLGPGLTPADYQYQLLTWDHYADIPPAILVDQLYASLGELDYVVLGSNRVSAAVTRAPWRYPVQIRFFELLRGGQLGYDPVATFQVSPTLGPLIIDDRGADESFINYDHPRVEIYAKRQLVSRDVYDRLMAWSLAQPWSPTRHRP